VPVGNLQPGDRVALRPGDRVPTDGEVVEGASAVDESMLTGESLPVDKAPGAKVYGGTVNQNGRLLLRVTATGDTTALAQIIAVVERAQNSRAAIQKLGDRVSSVFVPVVIVIAVATALWWGLAPDSVRHVHEVLAPWLWPAVLPQTALAAAFIQAAAVLIVACPCAMGLATPTAIMAGTNVAARRGILIRDGAALEKSGRITAVLFDKTGTLTQGRVTVAAAEDLRYDSARTVSIQQLAAGLARPSNHPLSRAVAALAPADVPLAGWQEERGAGLRAHWAERGGAFAKTTLRLGSLNWLREEGVNLSAGDGFAHTWSANGATLLGLAADHRLIGLLALRDELKPDAPQVVTRLRQLGQRVYLVTGDSRATASAIAGQTGVPAGNVFAEVRPEQKAGIVQQLQQRGERVAFVGDGINDAPALEQADLGIAVSQASDVAREAADILLLKSDIHAVPEALGLAQATLRTIKQNLFWAFFYNAAAVPLAALGFLNPVLCAAAMGLSDLIVIGNALRLRRWKG
jgi:Cu+-exporting ATPase